MGSDLAVVLELRERFPPQTHQSQRKLNETDFQTKKEDMDSCNILPGKITEIFTLGSKNSLTQHFDSRFPR